MAYIPAISAGVGVASRLLSRRRRPNIRGAIAELRSARPTGYLTPEDYRSAALTQSRLGEAASGAGELAGAGVSRRARARGLAGSPSEERDLARVSQQVLLGKQHAGEAASEQLYNTQRGREAFQQQSELGIFGASVGMSRLDAARQDAQQSEFWNSLNEFIPSIMSYLPASGLPENALQEAGNYTAPLPQRRVTGYSAR